MNQKIKSNSSFGKNLREIRKMHGYTQEEIVAKLQLIFHVAHMPKLNVGHIISESPNWSHSKKYTTYLMMIFFKV